ncbi:MAG: hypothetical protein K8T89_07240 [Planctomycetes bacterium]|nr:hypothetical protein [Planctomycetota bacterium]
MAAQKPGPEDLKRVEELAKAWGKVIVRQHWGKKGPGLDATLTHMEEVAMSAVRALLAGTRNHRSGLALFDGRFLVIIRSHYLCS